MQVLGDDRKRKGNGGAIKVVDQGSCKEEADDQPAARIAYERRRRAYRRSRDVLRAHDSCARQASRTLSQLVKAGASLFLQLRMATLRRVRRRGFADRVAIPG